MKDELKHIDELYKSNLENYQEEAGKEVWRNMRWILFWLRYRLLFGVASVVLLLGLLSLFFIDNLNTSDNSTITENNNTELILSADYQTEEIQEPENSTFSNNNEITNTGSLSKKTDIKASSPNKPPVNILSEIIEINNTDERNKNNLVLDYNKSLTEISRKNYAYKIASSPDSNLLGYNRRTDLLPLSHSNNWVSVNIYAGPTFSKSDISGYNSEYLAFRNNNESNKEGWSLGVDLRFHLKNWIISTGLNYSIYNQSRAYMHSSQEYSPDDSYYNYDTTWIWVFDPPNYGIPIVTGIDSSWVKVYNNITIDNSGLNQLKYLEIPLLVGYSFNSNLFTFEINAGVSAGYLIYSSVKAPAFNNLDDIITVEQMNNTIFNVLANVSIYYHINSKMSLFMSPYYKQNLISVFNNDYPVKQRFKTSGLNFGISFQF
jgi:hypothetical protein